MQRQKRNNGNITKINSTNQFKQTVLNEGTIKCCIDNSHRMLSNLLIGYPKNCNRSVRKDIEFVLKYLKMDIELEENYWLKGYKAEILENAKRDLEAKYGMAYGLEVAV